jgi:hypothetical protein
VTLRKADENGVLSIEGLLESPAPGHYFFQRQTAPGVAGAMVGFVRFDQSPKAWRIDPSGPGGAPVLNAVELDQLICVGKPLPPPGLAEATAPAASPDAPGTPQFVPQAHPSTFPLPTVVNGVVPLESLPGAPGVIYLDFDGEAGPFSSWGGVTGNAAPSGASNAQIKEVWQRVAEDYQPFNLNVTTDRRIYDSMS